MLLLCKLSPLILQGCMVLPFPKKCFKFGNHCLIVDWFDLPPPLARDSLFFHSLFFQSSVKQCKYLLLSCFFSYF